AFLDLAVHAGDGEIKPLADEQEGVHRVLGLADNGHEESVAHEREKPTSNVSVAGRRPMIIARTRRGAWTRATRGRGSGRRRASGRPPTSTGPDKRRRCSRPRTSRPAPPRGWAPCRSRRGAGWSGRPGS